jgi:CheY-like chemotaxis protein
MSTQLNRPRNGQAMAPLRVLVIDDDDVARDVIVDVLEHDGHQVTSLPSPIGATKHIVDQNVDVVVLDLMMPRNPKLKHLGVVLVTSARLEDVSALAETMGSVAIVSKGGIHSDLLPAVKKAARRS